MIRYIRQLEALLVAEKGAEYLAALKSDPTQQKFYKKENLLRAVDETPVPV